MSSTRKAPTGSQPHEAGSQSVWLVAGHSVWHCNQRLSRQDTLHIVFQSKLVNVAAITSCILEMYVIGGESCSFSLEGDYAYTDKQENIGKDAY